MSIGGQTSNATTRPATKVTHKRKEGRVASLEAGRPAGEAARHAEGSLLAVTLARLHQKSNGRDLTTDETSNLIWAACHMGPASTCHARPSASGGRATTCAPATGPAFAPTAEKRLSRVVSARAATSRAKAERPTSGLRKEGRNTTAAETTGPYLKVFVGLLTCPLSGTSPTSSAAQIVCKRPVAGLSSCRQGGACKGPEATRAISAASTCLLASWRGRRLTVTKALSAALAA